MKDFQARNPRFATRPKSGSRASFFAWSAALLLAAAVAAGVYFAPELALLRDQLQAPPPTAAASQFSVAP